MLKSRMIFLVLVLVMCLSGQAYAVIDLGSGASEIQPHSGSFTHDIQIPSAPSVAGMQPTLQLNYSSSQGNGMYGYGWRLNVARIERSLKKGKPLYTNADTFVLWMNGRAIELVSIGNDQYRAKHEGQFLGVFKVGTHWIIKDKTGSSYYFGEDDQGQHSQWPQSLAQPFSWHLSKVVNTSGNSMRYFYTDDNYGHRLTRVVYPPNNTLVLGYEIKPAKDQRSYYNSGYKKSVGVRLSWAKSVVNGDIDANGQVTSGQLAHHFSFGYKTLDAKDSRSLLGTVTRHPVSEYLSPATAPVTTEFNYTGKNVGSILNPGYGLPDINGDSDDDVIQTSYVDNFDWTVYGVFAQVSPSYANSTAYSFDLGRKTACGIPLADRYGLVDLNGDGLLDKVLVDSHMVTNDARGCGNKERFDGTFKVYFNNGSGYKGTAETWNDPAMYSFSGTTRSRGELVDAWGFADVNGDGLKDRVSLITYQNGLLGGVSGVFLNTGSDFETVSSASTYNLGLNGIQNNNPIPNISTSVWANTPLLTAVTDNSSGMRKDVTYASTTVTMSTGKYMSLWVATKIQSSGPAVETRSTSYVYSGGLFNDPAKEFRGFATFEQADDQSGIKTVTGFHQTSVFMGMPSYSETRTANGSVISRVDNVWSAKNPDSPQDYGSKTVYLQSSTESKYELDGSLIFSKTRSTTVDKYNQPLTTTESTSDGFRKQVVNSYGDAAQCSTIQQAVTTMTTVTKTRYINVTDYRWIQYAATPSYVYNSAYYIRYKAWWHPTKSNGQYAYNNAASYFYGLYHKRIGRDGPYQKWGGYWETYTYQIPETYTIQEPQTTYVDVPDPNCWKMLRLTRAEITSTSSINGVGLKRTSSFKYNTQGFLTKEIVEPDNAALRLDSDYTYDGFNNRVTTTVSGNSIMPHTTTVAYDANGTFPISTSNALVHTESYVWDARFGSKIRLTGPNGLTTSWQYDGFGRKVREDRADGTFTSIDLSNAPASITSTASGSNPSTVWYDTRGREIKSVATGFDGSLVYKEVAYDSLGRKWREYLPYTVSPNLFTEFAYDSLSRVISVTNPNGDIARSSYNGFTTTTTNSKGQTTTTVKNSQGKVVSVTDSNNGTMNYAYDAFGNLIQTTDIAGNITTMSYDIRGRKISMNDPDMGIWSYEYDTLGNLISQTDAKNQVTSMQYDLLGRMTSRTEAEGASSWAYDSQWIGALTSESSPTASKSYSYDGFGRVVSSTSMINAQSYTVATTYDNFGRISSLTYPTGLVIQRNYNAFHYMHSITNANTGAMIWQADSVDEFGRTVGESFGNGVSTTHSYDAIRGTLMGLQSTSNGADIQNWSYDYDAVGNMLYRTDAVVGYTENFTYDNLNRLETVSNSAGVLQKSYVYDAIGNITSKSDVGSYTYDPNHPHAVQTAGGNTYIYDANGNQTSGAGRTLQWTSFNKASGIWTATGYTGFEYDANHNRITKTTPTSHTVYIGKIFEEITIGGLTKDRNHIYAGSKLVASIENNVGGLTNTRYMHGDHLGSISVITDELGQVVERLRFDVFGAPINLNGTAKAMGSSNTSRGYTGHEMDASTGLINMNARLYDPILSRFLSADTVVPGAGNMQNFNRYAYVLNNPLRYTDPSGHWSLGNLWKSVRTAIIIAAVAVLTYYTAGYAMGAYSGVGFSGAASGGAAISGASAAGGASFSTLAGSSMGTAMVGGAVGGAVSSGSLTAIAGGNINQVGQAALMGGIAGGIGAGVGYGFSSAGYGGVGKVASNVANAGIQSRGNMRVMGQAALMAGAMVVADKIFTGTINHARKEGMIRGSGEAGDFLTTATPGDPVRKSGNIAFAGLNANGRVPAALGVGLTASDVVTQSSEFGVLTVSIAKSPLALNPTALVHDVWGQIVENTNEGLWNPVTNYGLILPAAAVSYGAFASYTPVAASLAVQ